MGPASCQTDSEGKGRYTGACHFWKARKKPAVWCFALGILLATLLLGNSLLRQQIKPSLLAFGSSFSDANSVGPFWSARGTTGRKAAGESHGAGSNESGGRTAYVMLVHVLSRGVLDGLRHLTSDLGGRDVFIIYDETKHPFPEVSQSNEGFFTHTGLLENIVVVNKEGLRRISPWFESAHEHIQTLLVAFYRSVLVERDSVYDQVWFLESDVRCNGDYKRTFAKADGIAADFLGRWTAGRNDNRGVAVGPWNWARLKGVPMADRWGAFLPVMRLSRRGLQSLSEGAARDVAGFCEVYIPTMVHVAGGAMGSLPEEMLAPGGYRYRPQMTQAEYEDLRREGATDVLYHPVVG